MKMYRQGDVIIMESDSIKTGSKIPRENGKIVLAHGEVTGHSHAIASRSATLFESKEQQDAALALGTRLLKVLKPVVLRHEEHAPISIPKGTWLIRIQREYSPENFTNVSD